MRNGANLFFKLVPQPFRHLSLPLGSWISLTTRASVGGSERKSYGKLPTIRHSIYCDFMQGISRLITRRPIWPSTRPIRATTRPIRATTRPIRSLTGPIRASKRSFLTYLVKSILLRCFTDGMLFFKGIHIFHFLETPLPRLDFFPSLSSPFSPSLEKLSSTS